MPIWKHLYIAPCKTKCNCTIGKNNTWARFHHLYSSWILFEKKHIIILAWLFYLLAHTSFAISLLWPRTLMTSKKGQTQDKILYSHIRYFFFSWSISFHVLLKYFFFCHCVQSSTTITFISCYCSKRGARYINMSLLHSIVLKHIITQYYT